MPESWHRILLSEQDPNALRPVLFSVGVPNGFSGGAVDSYAYAWQRCDIGGGGCVPVGTDDDQYVLTADDAGHRMRVTVTATNGVGSGDRGSNATRAVSAAS